jgi:hypothetical protein
MLEAATCLEDLRLLLSLLPSNNNQDTTATTPFRLHYPRYRAAGSWRTR